MVPPGDQAPGPCRRQQGQSGPRREGQARPAAIPAAGQQIEHIIKQGWAGVHRLDLLLQRLQVGRAQLAGKLGRLERLALQQGPLRFPGRKAQVQAHQEAIQLGFGQGRGAALVEAVLGGDHQEGLRQRVADAIDAHPAVGHGLQQGALGAGAGPVDFIGQQHLAEQGTGVKIETAALAVKHIQSGQIRRQQITGEAHPAKVQTKPPGQGFRQAGFTGAG